MPTPRKIYITSNRGMQRMKHSCKKYHNHQFIIFCAVTFKTSRKYSTLWPETSQSLLEITLISSHLHLYTRPTIGRKIPPCRPTDRQTDQPRPFHLSCAYRVGVFSTIGFLCTYHRQAGKDSSALVRSLAPRFMQLTKKNIFSFENHPVGPSLPGEKIFGQGKKNKLSGDL